MNKNLCFDFSINKETNTISVKREFAAELRLVWDAWTKPELLDIWWGSEGWNSETKSMEFKINGRRHYVMKGPENEMFWGITSYNSIKLHDSFSGEDYFSDEKGNVNKDFPQSVYNIVFKTKGNITLIEHHTIYPNKEQLEASVKYGFEEGMLGAFARLDDLIK